jgi:hypothetical protein
MVSKLKGRSNKVNELPLSLTTGKTCGEH